MAKRRKDRVRKDSFEDNGRTIVNMDLEGTPWARKSRSSHHRKGEGNELKDLNLTPKERRAIFWGAMSVVIPIAIAFVVLYFLALLILDLVWLR